MGPLRPGSASPRAAGSRSGARTAWRRPASTGTCSWSFWKPRAGAANPCRVLATNMPPKVGDLVSGKYRLVRVIGDGGMGTVFEAKHEYLGTTVALKFLHPEMSERQ